MRSIKTRSVKFSYGTVKDATLLVPAEACSLVDIVSLIRRSYLEYAFRPGCGLMSDEVLVSSLGRSNFFDGALGGYKTRLSAEDFNSVKELANHDAGLALDAVRFRNPGLSRREVYILASKNEALSETDRKFLEMIADHSESPAATA